MLSVIVVAFVLVVLLLAVFAGLFATKKEVLLSGTSAVLSVLILFSLVFFIAPKELGWGRVPTVAEEYAKRLDMGVVYQLLHVEKDGADQILVVKDEKAVADGKHKYYAIRVTVKNLPPEHFALVTVSGKVFAIVPPTD